MYVLVDEKKKNRITHPRFDFAADYPEKGETSFHTIYHATIEELNEKFMYALSLSSGRPTKKGGQKMRQKNGKSSDKLFLLNL